MRLTKVRELLAQHNLDAMLISQPENRRYLAGFTGSAGWLIVTADRALLATDFRYFDQVAREAPAFELVRVEGQFSDLLPQLMVDLQVQRLGFESQYVTVAQLYEWSQETAGMDWLPLEDSVEALRAVKGAAEVEALRRSAALTDEAFAHLVQRIEPGMTEREAAWEIEAYMRTHGASKVAFDLIVAAGPNGALPHARAGDRAIQPGEPVVVDIGCILDGYCSDMTRTFCLGQPGPEYLEVWHLVLQAQEAAEARIRAGLSGVEADAIARAVIDEAGYGEYFGHGLGHGVGLAIHEGPRAGRLSRDRLEAGMSLTIEPGIYLPGRFGVRLEDLAIIHKDGIEILTNTPKMPVVDC